MTRAQKFLAGIMILMLFVNCARAVTILWPDHPLVAVAVVGAFILAALGTPRLVRDIWL